MKEREDEGFTGLEERGVERYPQVDAEGAEKDKNETDRFHGLRPR